VTIRGYYEGYFDEDGRLTDSSIEWMRSKELVSRALPQAPARVADVAGGTGPYAVWLAEMGYQVSLLDLVPSHVAQAQEKANAARVVVDCVEGDARALPWADDTFDVVLVMGALYHLQDRDDRLACLREAHRVLKPGGALVASYISRWASLFDGYRYGFVADGRFAAILDEDLSSGRHENAFGHPLWFTSSYFHTPDEIREELASVEFEGIQVLPVEGFTSVTGVPEDLRTEVGMAKLSNHLRATETEPALIGVSSHLISISRKAAEPPI
jgi:ubiquinone/menaquinone biosynthesis C-methylase UbiE